MFPHILESLYTLVGIDGPTVHVFFSVACCDIDLSYVIWRFVRPVRYICQTL
jgi:hypothetical protein